MDLDASTELSNHMDAMKLESRFDGGRERAGSSSSACDNAVTGSARVSQSQASARQSKKPR